MILHALVEKWRELEEDAVSNGDFLIAATLRTCADELESALAVGGEAAAWMDHMGGVITAAMKAADPGRPYNTPLFPNPAGAVQVDDAMIDRAVDAYRETYRDYSQRMAIGAALTAALNPGGSRE